MNNPDTGHPLTFKSAVGAFYYGLLVIVFAGTYAAFAPAITSMNAAMLFPFIVSVVFGCGLPVWLLFATDYTITDTQLLARCGPFKWRIRRSDIRSIKPSRSWLSSPALSLDRLEIRYGNHGVILVSPKDRMGFYKALGFTPQPDL